MIFLMLKSPALAEVAHNMARHGVFGTPRRKNRNGRGSPRICGARALEDTTTLVYCITNNLDTIGSIDSVELARIRM